MAFAETLISWYDDHKRDLPWRGETDPYKIWVSEIILQQTRVQQGWDYYLRFLDNFPTVKALAEADEERVLKVWQGLGYYSRARNMHAAAREIMSEHNGKFPQTYDKILSLKGIGKYTAAAVASIAFHLPYPAVDGNVIRIISRIFGVCEDVSQPAVVKRITDICNEQIDHDRPGVFNQAAMDFGAMHCTPKNPQCYCDLTDDFKKVCDEYHKKRDKLKEEGKTDEEIDEEIGEWCDDNNIVEMLDAKFEEAIEKLGADTDIAALETEE